MIKQDPHALDEPRAKRGRGRPRKEKTQTAEERAAYLREYNQRPEVIQRRRAYMKEYRRQLRERETAEERAERLEYNRIWARESRARKKQQGEV